MHGARVLVLVRCMGLRGDLPKTATCGERERVARKSRRIKRVRECTVALDGNQELALASSGLT